MVFVQRLRWCRRFVPAVRIVLICASVVLLHAAGAQGGDYVVGEGDTLQIAVFGHPDLTTTERVTREGQIRLPLIGQVFVAGIALPRIADIISARLADGYLVNPQVTVSVQEYRSRKANIIGMVNRPGVYEFRGMLSLLELLSRAGGLSPDAGSRAVVTGSAGESRAVDLRGLLTLGDTSLDIEVRDGDTVFIAAAGRFSITGEVRRPGEYRHEEGMTTRRAIILAGGVTPDADNRAVITGRSGESRTIDLRGLLTLESTANDVDVRDGDTIFIAAAGRFSITGEVRRPGEYRHEEGMTFIRAVTLAGGFSEHAATDSLKVIRPEGDRERLIEVGGATALEGPVRRGDIIVVSAARAEVCYVTGEVKSAGAYRCDRETNVLKAVTLAGGFTDAAAKNRIRIVRRVDGQEQVREKVGLEEAVLPDDIIVIPKSFF